MYRRSLLLIGSVFLTVISFGQAHRSSQPAGAAQQKPGLARPKLVVGIVVDQMRWDYLYRYYDRYGTDGFRRMLGEGFTCENTLINYLPSYTAVGHTCVFTGSVPALDGISGND